MQATEEKPRIGAQVKPITQRPVDLFFVVAFGVFIITCVFFDSLNGLNIPISPTSGNAFARLTYEIYAKDSDLLLIANPFWTQIVLGISAFVFAPFYAVAIYALVKGRDWIHIPAIAF